MSKPTGGILTSALQKLASGELQREWDQARNEAEFDEMVWNLYRFNPFVAFPSNTEH